MNKNGVHVDDHKVDKINHSVPSSPRIEILWFLRFVLYYRRFIPGLASISKPLVEKTFEKVKFAWIHSMQEYFGTLKEKLTTAPLLVYPDYGKHFIVSADVSSKATGTVLS